MLKKPNFKLNKLKQQSIKQMNQSKQMDTIERQLQKNDKYLNSQFYEIESHRNQKDSQSQTTKKNFTQAQSYIYKQKYSPLNQSQSQEKYKINDYRSANRFHSTQPTSPYNNFSTQRNFNEGKSQKIQSQLKKKLFLDESIQNSPQFKQKQLQSTDLVFTFKKKIDLYQRQFLPTAQTQRKSSSKKLHFESINYGDETDYVRYSCSRNLQSTFKQNDSSRTNVINNTFNAENKQDQKQRSTFLYDRKKVNKKLIFQNIPTKQQVNPIIKQINQQIRLDQLYKQQLSKNQDDVIKKSRNNQKELIRRKIMQSKNDLKRFYQVNSNDVQYQYHKAKFMDNFLGTKLIQRKDIFR